MLTMGELISLDGGNPSGAFFAPRNPFWSKTQVASLCPSYLTLYSPTVSTYYTNNIRVDFISDGKTCRVRTSGNWTTLPCNYNHTRTFYEGYNTLFVESKTAGCTIGTNVTFYVQTHISGGVVDEGLLVFIPLGCMVLLFLFSGKRKRKRLLKNIKKYDKT